MRVFVAVGLVTLVISLACRAQVRTSPEESAIQKRIGELRKTPDDQRSAATKQIALDIRALPKSVLKVGLASGLANLATEGDFGRDTLQEVATTLATALEETPPAGSDERAMSPYLTLAQLVRYERVTAAVHAPLYAKALAELKENDRGFQQANFTLPDTNGQSHTLRDLRGKVVLVNFWATWCPPCMKEIPDIEALYEKHKEHGLVVLGITDEKIEAVRKSAGAKAITYTILLDSDRKVNGLYKVRGIPRTFLYGRDGKLVAQAIDMRTRRQLEAMLAKAGLK